MGKTSSFEHLLLVSTCLVLLIKAATGISCYQCISTDHTNPFQCNEYLEDVDLVPESCDAVYEAQYCIKHTGRFEASSISCYQCLSTTDIACTDSLIHEGADSIKITNCDHVFEAQYCIKTSGLYGGGLGTKRFCSSLDLGNYCNYIQQPGDELEYRSCVYTCSSDGCNPANLVTTPPVAILLAIGTSSLLYSKMK